MKKCGFLIIFCAIMNMVHAQQPDTTIVFNKAVHDFGAFAKSDGVQTYTFEYTNTGKQPVVIQDVKSSCGCTTPDWTKEPVTTGQKGYVKVSYNPTGATTFNKSVTVSLSGGSPEIVTLYVRGTVTATSEN
jgi:hypothetical protein